MKAVFLPVVSLLLCLSMASGQGKILTTDPLTGLPLMPPSESAKKVGNAPVKMPDGTVCKCKMQGNFYKIFDYFAKDNITLADTIAWYSSHLSGFNKVQASDHSQTAFYNSDRTIVVIVTSEPHPKDGVEKTSSVSYERYQPGLSEKTVTSLTQKKIVCN
jgi:hypothetical protein